MMKFSEIEKDIEIIEYIKKSDSYLKEIGFTEHSLAHVKHTALLAGEILETLGYSEREIELAKISGFMHDIGNMINRNDHAHLSATLAFTMLRERGFNPEDVAEVCSAIGNHDEGTGNPVSAVSAALILADKTDVRRSRVRDKDYSPLDIHDRVNYAVTDSSLKLNLDKKEAVLKLNVDVEVSPVMDYFEIFLGRMLMCKRAASYLGLRFRVIINETKIL